MTISGIDIPDAFACAVLANLRHLNNATSNIRAERVDTEKFTEVVAISADTPEGETFTYDMIVSR